MVCDDGSETEDSSNDEDEESEATTTPTTVSSQLDSTNPIISTTTTTTTSASDTNITPSSSAESGSGEAEKKEEKDKKKEGKGQDSKEEGPEDKGDPEMAPVYLQRLLPIFTEIYHSSLAPALRKESLRLMRKMCRYISTKCLQELCQEATPTDPTHPLFLARISEVLAAVMETEDDHESHLSALHIMQDLLGKNRAAFDEQFVRLGLPNKIAALGGLLESETAQEAAADAEEGVAKEPEATEEMDASREGEGTAKEAKAKEGTTKEAKEGTAKEGKANEAKAKEGTANEGTANEGTANEEAGEEASPPAPSTDENKPPTEEKVCLEDATEIVANTPYQWRDWCVVRSRDCLYLWNDYCLIELSNVSNGWFRFLVDSRLATMYSSGSTEGGPDSYGELRRGGGVGGGWEGEGEKEAKKPMCTFPIVFYVLNKVTFICGYKFYYLCICVATLV